MNKFQEENRPYDATSTILPTSEQRFSKYNFLAQVFGGNESPSTTTNPYQIPAAASERARQTQPIGDRVDHNPLRNILINIKDEESFKKRQYGYI
jgi:hypothetical protein